MLAVIALLCAFGVFAGEGQVEAQELPLGEFSVVPTAGAIGSVVTVSGDFDRDITKVSFRCLYRELGEEALDPSALYLEVPSPSFTFQYTIPAELTVRQYTDVIYLPPGGECAFFAEAGHQHATAQVDFTVIEDPATMPLAGLSGDTDAAPARPIAAYFLALGGIALVSLAWRARRAA